MVKRIIVLSDGTWETVGDAQILTITDDAYDNLLDGISEIRDLKEDSDITDIKEIE
jgi:hypothetical protein